MTTMPNTKKYETITLTGLTIMFAAPILIALLTYLTLSITGVTTSTGTSWLTLIFTITPVMFTLGAIITLTGVSLAFHAPDQPRLDRDNT